MTPVESVVVVSAAAVVVVGVLVCEVDVECAYDEGVVLIADLEVESYERKRGREVSKESHGDGEGDDNKSSSPVPSPGSWNVDRGRSRVRRPSNPFSEDSLRRR